MTRSKFSLHILASVILASTTFACAPMHSLSHSSNPNEETGTEADNMDPVTPAPADLAQPFVETELSVQQEISVLDAYQHLDPSHIVPTDLLKKAVTYFDANKSRFQNQSYMAICDFAKHSKLKRFYIINMKTGAVASYAVAHGKGSDPDNDGIATTFSNSSGSGASSVGYYRTDTTYSGKHGLSLRIDGLSSTNSNVRSRAVVIHGASYSEPSYIASNGRAGRSLGCFAVADSLKTEVVTKLKGGALLFAGQSGKSS
jgi:hypothetical protein